MTVNPQQLRTSIPWQKIQEGLARWVHGVTGLVTIWGRFPGGVLQPVRPYASLDIVSGPTPVGRDGVGQRVVSGAPAGQELTPYIFGLRRIGITVDVFSGNADPANGLPLAVNLADTAVSYVSSLLASLSIDSIVQQLKAAHVALSSFGEIRNLSYPEESVMVSRYQLEFECLTALASVGADAFGYVNEVIGTGTETDKSISIPFDVKGPG